MQKFNFKRSALAHGVAVALGATVATPIMAQDGSEEVIEEIVTTGIRGSLMQSMDRKRNAKGVVDAITSEDIGKFPDQNLAESLQRITGVSIDRSNNEGSQITVRGMGPEFNLVTLNGRTLPTAGSRSFDFGDLATEGVQAVEVYKTTRAGLPTGGIGATVNILTAKPLANPGFRSVLSGKIVNETSTSNSNIAGLDELTPELAGMFSNTFADDTIGVLLTASYQERDNREESAAVDNWLPNGQIDLDNPAGTVTNNNQRADGTFWHPQNVGYQASDISRDRTNAQLVLQYAPNDRLTTTLDYTYSEVDFERDSNSFGIWFECPNIDATINERGTVTEVTQSCGDLSNNVGRDRTTTENGSLGVNIDWQATDSLSFALDIHDSSSKFGGGDINGEEATNMQVFIGNTNCNWCGFTPDNTGPFTAGIDEQTAFYTAGGIPTYNVTFQDGQGNPLDYPRASDMGTLFALAFNSEQENTILQTQLKGSWENMDDGAIRRIDFGFSQTEQEFTVAGAYSGQLPAGFWLTSAQYMPDGDPFLRDFSGMLGGFGGLSAQNSQIWAQDFDYLVDIYETAGKPEDFVYNLYWNAWPDEFIAESGDRGRLWPGPLGNDGEFLVDEKIQSFYTSVTFEDMFNNMPFNAVLGVRYENAEVTSYGIESPPAGIRWITGNEFTYLSSVGEQTRRGDGDNNYFLPNIDMDLEVYENMIARFSYSRSIARPPIGSLLANRSFPGNPNIRSRFVERGNPELLPYVSDNVDLSFEWYYGNGSYASVGHFRKRVDNFLVTSFEETTFPELGLTDPYIGALAEAAREDLAANNEPLDDASVFARINELRGTPITDPIDGAASDPLAVYTVSSVANEEVGNLFGWEFAVQHMFEDTGFGIQANLTIVNGDVDADRDVINQSFALPGLSDTANLSVFYEDERISARLAYNWRDEFLTGFDQYGSPIFTEEYTPLDLNLTWYATDNLDLFFQAINITDEVQRTYVRYPEQLIRANEYGSRFNIGARYNF